MSIEEDIIKWNNAFPVDRWWRQKYNVPYGSKKHKECDFFDQLFEYKEEKAFERLHESQVYKQGDWLKKQEKTEKEKVASLQEEAKQMLDKFDDDEFNDL